MARLDYIPSVQALADLPSPASEPYGAAFYVESALAMVATNGRVWVYITGVWTGRVAWPRRIYGESDLAGFGDLAPYGKKRRGGIAVLQGRASVLATGWPWRFGVVNLEGVASIQTVGDWFEQNLPGDGVTLGGVGWTGSTSLIDYPKYGPVYSGAKYVNWVDGSDSNSGNSLTLPYKSLEKGLDNLSAGERLVVIGDGVQYDISSTLQRGGTHGSTMEVMAYGNHRPVLDFSGVSNNGFELSGSNEHWKGFEIQDIDNYGMLITGDDYVMEDVLIHDVCTDVPDSSGVRIYGSSADNNIVQDFIIWRIGPFEGNPDNPTNVADGLVCTTTGGTAGNVTSGHVFARSLVADAPDDCYDLFLGYDIKILDSVAYRAGYHYEAGAQGDGTGFKMGGVKGDANGGGNTLQGSLAVGCRSAGIINNGAYNPQPIITFDHNTAADNTRGFIINPTTLGAHVATNNVSDGNPTYDLSKTEPVDDTYNDWNLGIGNPQLYSRGSPDYDYSLASGSPAIGVGTSGSNLGASDIALKVAKKWIPYVNAN